ncbi:hypothetical protein K458DRAFT_395420 [Lentithecium fluviatile CBS 122367]|uniref:Uncharacterized protein n=1 Tax=Lentithecium fluviatile CBS 122367 TaxID=1168545 RepID=A0A6G1IIM9_9PLEO|nr:hypothetical protein K458DRAFT_395420 [Lentithecium fluviatile CBS 122367]
MANLKKTWFLVPTWKIPSSAVRPSYLITEPTDPRYPINPERMDASGIPATIYTEVFTSSSPELRMELSEDSATTLGIWGQFLHFVGLSAEAKLTMAKGIDNTYEFETMIFKSKEVQEYLEIAGVKKPLYMINGVKTVTGASLFTSHTKGFS